MKPIDSWINLIIHIGVVGGFALLLTACACEVVNCINCFRYGDLANIIRGYCPIKKARLRWNDKVDVAVTYKEFETLFKYNPDPYAINNATFVRHSSIQRLGYTLYFPNFRQYYRACQLIIGHRNAQNSLLKESVVK